MALLGRRCSVPTDLELLRRSTRSAKTSPDQHRAVDSKLSPRARRDSNISARFPPFSSQLSHCDNTDHCGSFLLWGYSLRRNLRVRPEAMGQCGELGCKSDNVARFQGSLRALENGKCP